MTDAYLFSRSGQLALECLVMAVQFLIFHLQGLEAGRYGRDEGVGIGGVHRMLLFRGVSWQEQQVAFVHALLRVLTFVRNGKRGAWLSDVHAKHANDVHGF